MVLRELRGDAASVVNTFVATFMDNLSRAGIVQIPGVGALVLMDVEEFQPRSVRTVVSQMYSITMTEACGIEQRAIVVECCRSPYDFVAAVTIYIGHRKIMVAIAIHRVATFAGLALLSGISACLTKAVGDVILCLRLRRMEPLLLQLLPIEAHRPDKSIGIIAA